MDWLQKHPITEDYVTSAGAGERHPMVLVVDDDPHVRQALIMLLSGEGLGCLGARDALDAIGRLRRGEVYPDLILLDLMMPGMDGWEFRAAQLADPELADIPVVMLTAATLPGSRASELGIRHLLRKPVDIDRLLDVIQRYLPHWQPET
jgi:CheY-like chemotaxis protein